MKVGWQLMNEEWKLVGIKGCEEKGRTRLGLLQLPLWNMTNKNLDWWLINQVVHF
jgi:hypothetical protein